MRNEGLECCLLRRGSEGWKSCFLDKRKCRGEIIEIYIILEAGSKVNVELLFSQTYSTRNRVYLMKPEVNRCWAVISFYLISELLGTTGSCKDTDQLQEGLDKFREKRKY